MDDPHAHAEPRIRPEGKNSRSRAAEGKSGLHFFGPGSEIASLDPIPDSEQLKEADIERMGSMVFKPLPGRILEGGFSQSIAEDLDAVALGDDRPVRGRFSTGGFHFLVARMRHFHDIEELRL